MATKPSIVFAHGLWADGSCFSKLIPTLQAEGHEVIAAQNSLDSLKGDVAAVQRALGRFSSPAILVGHSYGGTVKHGRITGRLAPHSAQRNLSRLWDDGANGHGPGQAAHTARDEGNAEIEANAQHSMSNAQWACRPVNVQTRVSASRRADKP